MRKIVLVSAALLASLSFVAVSRAQSSDSKIILAIGSGQKTSIYDRVHESFEKETGIKIELLSQEGMGGTNCIVAVDTGKADVGLAAMDPELAIKSLEEKGNRLKNKEHLKFVEVGSESTHFITHPALARKVISPEELTKILSGDVNNWKEIGGPDVKIEFAYPAKFTATQALVIRYLNKDRPLRPGIKFLNSMEAIVDYVAKTPGAIGMGGSVVLSPKVGQPKHPPLDRKIWWVTLGEPSTKARKLLGAVQKLGK